MRRMIVTATAFCLAASSVWAGDPKVGPFISKIYKNYDATGSGIDPLDKNARTYFDDTLIRLFKLDKQRAGDEMGAIDYNPLCSCQDFDIKNVSFVEKSSDAKLIVVDVTFENFGTADQVSLVLSRTKAGLRIYDIGDKQTPSIRQVLANPGAN